MGIKPRAGGEDGGYVVNVQVLGPTTALGWVGAAFVLLGAWVFYKTEPAPGSTETEISSVPYKNTRIFYRERTILPVLVCQVWDLLRLAKNADAIKTRPIVPRVLAPTAVQEKCTPMASAPKIAAAANMIKEATRVDTRGRFSSAGSLLLWPRQTASSLVELEEPVE